MSDKPTPTESELRILKVLWECGPSTVKEIQKSLDREAGYTTVLKLLQIMYEKELVDREKEGRAHRYRSLLDQEETQQKMLGEFSDQLFGGSMQQLVQRAVTSKKLKHGELEELEQLLKQLKQEESPDD